MDWLLFVFLGVIVITVVLIFLALGSLVSLGDERKKFIKMRAQSYAFSVVIALLLIEIGQNLYLSFFSSGYSGGINPYIFLVVVSIVYLITLLVYKKKYGD